MAQAQQRAVEVGVDRFASHGVVEGVPFVSEACVVDQHIEPGSEVYLVEGEIPLLLPFPFSRSPLMIAGYKNRLV